jgi:hypothetical protein
MLTPEPYDEKIERLACTPEPVLIEGFNRGTVLPYGFTIKHLHRSMNDFTNFLGFINEQLNSKRIERLETMLMPANFSSIVGEFMSSSIPKHCKTLVKNQHHNGHPDMIPAGRFPNDAVQHADEGIEIKGSRYLKGWQGHNPEDTWLMVFVFDSNRPVDAAKGITPKPFRFLMVLGARLTKADWLFAGRSGESRRTITASVTKSGYQKMMANWIYKAPDLTKAETKNLLEPPRGEVSEQPTEE